MKNHDPEPWLTEDGERQNTSVVPYRLGRKTHADYQPRPEYDTDDPTPWRDPSGRRYTYAYLLDGKEWAPREGLPEPLAMAAVEMHFSQYVCGECDYNALDIWKFHQQHYEHHRRAEWRSASS